MGMFGSPKITNKISGDFGYAAEQTTRRLDELKNITEQRFSILEGIKKAKNENTDSPAILTSNPAKYMQAMSQYEKVLEELTQKIKDAAHIMEKPQAQKPQTEIPREETPRFGTPRPVRGG